jgi:hypothetical protein
MLIPFYVNQHTTYADRLFDPLFAAPDRRTSETVNFI